MAQKIRDVMTPDPVVLDATSTVTDAAREMRKRDVGDVLVQQNGSLCGIVTDRDIVIRSVADGRDPGGQAIGDLCSRELATLDGDAAVDDAIELMRERAIRRVPVVEGGAPIGIVSLGDLAETRDPESVLGQISGAPPSA